MHSKQQKTMDTTGPDLIPITEIFSLTPAKKLIHTCKYIIEIERCGMEMMWENTKVMRISRKLFTVRIMINQKQLADVEYFIYLGSITTNDARCTRDIKCRIVMAKAANNRKKTLFTSKLEFNLRKKLMK